VVPWNKPKPSHPIPSHSSATKSSRGISIAFKELKCNEFLVFVSFKWKIPDFGNKMVLTSDTRDVLLLLLLLLLLLQRFNQATLLLAIRFWLADYVARTKKTWIHTNFLFRKLIRRDYSDYGLFYLYLHYLTTLSQLKKLYSVEYDGKVIMNGEEVRVWKEAVVTCFKDVFQHSSGETEKVND
jgi:hypothetical protein